MIIAVFSRTHESLTFKFPSEETIPVPFKYCMFFKMLHEEIKNPACIFVTRIILVLIAVLLVNEQKEIIPVFGPLDVHPNPTLYPH